MVSRLPLASIFLVPLLSLQQPISSSLTAAAVDPCASPANPIVCENSKPGSPPAEWDLPRNDTGYGDLNIEGFATDISANGGERVHFKVKTNASAYRIDIYRLGYYAGLGARKIATVRPAVTLPQAQPACLFDAEVNLTDCANWSESASWDVPATAVSGVYLGKLVREDGTAGVNHIIFVVRNDASQSDLLFQTSDTTWQAYNRYGGYSLYFPSGLRAYKVSYNRPFATRDCCDETFFFSAEYPMVRWLEANGYDVSYFTGVDTARRGTQLQQHRVFLSVGHDEYVSGEQRANIEASGIHLAFFSGNEAFWKTRWESSFDGQTYRTLVCYKETHGGAKIDPTPIWTGTWRDARLSPPSDGGRPENALTGTLFTVNCCTSSADQTFSIQVPAEYGKFRLWRNTSVSALLPGAAATFPAGTLGYEWDEDVDNGARPPGLARLSSSTYSVNQKLMDAGNTFVPGVATHHLTLYRRSNGTLVFGAGTIRWAWGLDATHDYPNPLADVRMQQATVNLFADMGVQPASMRPGLVAAAPSADTGAPVSSINATSAVFQTQQSATITGSAVDVGGGAVAGVEVSVDGGATWHPASGWAPGSATWTHTWKPLTGGAVALKSRAVDDSANVEIPGAGITIAVKSRPCPCSIWGPNDAPAVASSGDTSSNELGLKFRADTSGYVTGMRFYKGSANTGTHVGHLWTAAGALLATASFATETASGWQQALFTSPVSIAAGQTYIVSYYAPNGGYSQDVGYFSSGGVNSSPLLALAAGVDGANGVYSYGVSGFPVNAGYQSSNYWVDVVFVTDVAPPPQPPAPPTLVVATPVSPTEIAVAWQASTGATGYRVDRSANGGTTWQTAGSTTIATTFANTGLTPATTYQYRVIATNAVGSSAPSGTATAQTLPAPTPPAPPAAVSATAVSSTGVTVTWQASTGATGYRIERAANGGTTWQTAGSTTGATTFADSGLTPATTYQYRVFATNAAGSSGPSSAATARTLPAPTPPAPPAGVSATAVSSTGITVTWQASTGATGYRVERAANGGTTWQTAGSTTGATTFADSGLAPATTYQYRVIATNAVGSSASSSTATARTLPETPPAAPAMVSATPMSSTAITVTWQASSRATGYRAERSANGGTSWQTAGSTTGETTFADTGLTPATTYQYRVIATNTAGSSTPSAVAMAKTPWDTTPPTQPQSVKAVASYRAVALSWGPSADAGGSGLAGYVVWRSTSGAAGTFEAITVTVKTSYTDENRQRNATYWYYVVAYDWGLNGSAPSSTVSARAR